MLSKRFQIVQLILTAVLAGLLMITLGVGWRPSPVSAAKPQAAAAQAVPGGPGYVMVPAVAFQPQRPTDGYLVFWGDMSVPAGSPNGITYFNAPVNLPQGATLTGLTMYYHDTTSDSYTLGVSLLRKPLPSINSGESVGLSVDSNQIDFGRYQSDTTPDASRAVVDNSQYSYWVTAYIYAAPTYLQLQAVRIDYSYNVLLPAIQR